MDSGLNMDFSKPAWIDAETNPWLPSPMPGVERQQLEREQAESGWTTSLVRYAPASYFRPHTHAGGEEFLVLEGVFSDQTGHFPQGTYVRNPIGSSHQPYTENGCKIFVKLCQMTPEEVKQTVVRTPPVSFGSGLQKRQIHALFENQNERVWLEHGLPGLEFSLKNEVRLEVLVLKGEWLLNGKKAPCQTWVRFPKQLDLILECVIRGSLWIKEYRN